MPSLSSQRHLFDIPGEIAYFNCAYQSPQLNESRSRLLFGAGTKSRPWERRAADFFDDADSIRGLASELFGGDADGYAVVPSASYGMGTAARAVEPQLRRGDGILVVAEEFPSGVLAWQRVAQETGAAVTTVPEPGRGGWTQAILDRIDTGVKVVAVSTCHWTNGAQIDLVAVGGACREVGSVLVVDATQSLGAVPLSIGEVQPDFLVAAGYKWLLCPYGFSLLYVAGRWRGARPLEETWQARANARDFAALTTYCGEYMPGARRFDAGEKCTPTILPGAIAALEQIKAWGVDGIAAALAETNRPIAEHLEGLGFRLPERSQQCPHFFGAQIPGRWPEDLVGQLRARKVFVSQRGSSIRIAPHLHITAGDTGRLRDALDELAP